MVFQHFLEVLLSNLRVILMEIFLSILIFILCFLGMSLGIVLAGKKIKGSCGGTAHLEKELGLSCGGCAKKEKEICPSDDETGLVEVATVHLNPDKKSH